MLGSLGGALGALVNLRFQRPGLLWVIPIAAALLLLVLSWEFVRLPTLPHERRRQRVMRVGIFLSRLLIISSVVVALAQPYGEITRETQGNPRVTVIIDESGSMATMDASFAQGLAEALGRRVNARVRTTGSNLTSDLGSAVLQNLEPGGNILIISDGNINSGAQLADVAFHATTINATISAINLTALEQDSSVLVTGPSKVVADSDATYIVTFTSSAASLSKLTVDVDGARVFDQDVVPGSYSFTKRFAQGNHRIEARLAGADAFADNNVFYKEVRVLPKPKILLLSAANSPLELLLRQLYDVDKKPVLPSDLSPYYAIVSDDLPVEGFGNTNLLHEYLIDEKGGYYGGGLVVFGGLNSYDRGGYSGSSLEPYLPVRVGKGERKKGNANLVFIVDVSGGTGKTKYRIEGEQLVAYNETVSTMDVIKAQVVAAIEQLKLDNKVGIILMGVQPGGETSSAEELLAASVKVMAPLDFLYNNRKDILEKVPRIVGGGPTAADIAFQGAVGMLRTAQGDRNIILLSDGRYSAGLGSLSPMKQQLLTLAANANKQYGISFMGIGVGVDDEKLYPLRVDEVFLKELAKAGDGTYDRATQLNSLLIKWGDPKAKEFGQDFILVPLSLTHFITQDVEPTAVLNAYSQVVPKDTAQLLIAADSGQPALTVWHYGNGRVATWTVFAGGNLGQLLMGNNSLLLSRTVNWAIGDPQRKEPFFVDIPDARINEDAYITVQSQTPVSSEGLEFTKDQNAYKAKFRPAALGFGLLLNQEYAVNRPSEFDRSGMNPALEAAAATTGGKIFKPTESDAIVELVEQASRRATTQRQLFITPFLGLAALLLLLEILLRRLTDRRHRP
jgi:hypothetical protein